MPTRADAEDLCQTVAIRAWGGFATFRGDSSFLTWVMSIAEREAARLGAKLVRTRTRETGWDAVPAEQVTRAVATAATERETGRTYADWLPMLAKVAHGAGFLGELEYRSVAGRLAHPGTGWDELAERLGSTPGACAAAHCRALPKLRVFLFLRDPGRLGGPSALAEAYQAACSPTASDPLTASEAEAFRLMVLARRTDYRKRGWQAALRAACTKVARHIDIA